MNLIIIIFVYETIVGEENLTDRSMEFEVNESSNPIHSCIYSFNHFVSIGIYNFKLFVVIK